MRLIDADYVLEFYDLGSEESREENYGEIFTAEDIDKIPTAFDVEKVIEQLEELIYPNLANNYKYVVNKCVEIVKAGGKE